MCHLASPLQECLYVEDEGETVYYKNDKSAFE